MEIGKFKLAKADLVRPPNKPAQEQIIPKQKPYTEKVFKLEVDDFIKGFIGGFPKDEMLLKIQSVLDKAVDAGAIEPQEGIKYLRERKQQLVDFARENYGQELPGIEEDRNNFAIGGGVIEGEDLGTREGFKEPLIRKGKVGTDREGLFGVRATNVSEADNIPGAVKFGKEQVYFNTEEEAKNYYKNRSKYFKPTVGKSKTRSDDPERLKKIDDYVKQFEKDYGKKPTAKNIRTALNEQARVIDIYEAKYKPLPKGTAITNVDTDVFKILKDPNVIKKLETGRFPSITDISKVTKLDPVLSESRLMDVAEKLADTKYANVAKNYLENTSLVNPDSPYGGSKGKRARIILENRFTKGMGIDQKLPNLRKDILDEIYKIIPELKGKGFLAVDEIAGLTSSMRGGFSPYPIFGQVTSSDFNTIQKGGTIDRTKGFLERKLKELKPGDPERAKLQKEYNDKVSSFVRESNIGNPAKKVKAFKLSFKPPSQTIKNKKVYNQFKDLFDEHYKKYGYSFEIPKDTESLLDIRDKLKTNKSFRNTVKQNFNNLIKSKGGKIGTAAFLATVTPTAFALADEKIADEKPVEGTKEGLPYEAALPAGIMFGKYAKPLLTGTLKTVGSLPAAVGFAGLETKAGMDEGKSFVDAVTEPMVGLNLLLPETVKKLGPLMAKGARISTPVGATITGIGTLKNRAQNMIRNAEELAAMQPNEQQQKLIEEYAAEDYKGYYNQGGRVNFADGPEDPKKRKFMKIMGGLASIPLLGRFIDIGTQAPKVAEVVKRTAEGVPDFLTDLIAKIKLKAEATGMKYFTGNRSDEFTNVYEADNFIVKEKGNTIKLREVDDPDRPGYRENEIELEVDPETGGVTYKEASVRPDDEGKLKDVEEYIDEEDLENMRKYTYDE